MASNAGCDFRVDIVALAWLGSWPLGIKMKPIAYVLLAVSCLLTCGWPMLAYLSIFAFDAPIKSPLDFWERIGGVCLLLSYPLGLLIGGFKIIYTIFCRRGEDWCTKFNIALVAMPIVHIALLVSTLVVVIWLYPEK